MSFSEMERGGSNEYQPLEITPIRPACLVRTVGGEVSTRSEIGLLKAGVAGLNHDLDQFFGCDTEQAVRQMMEYPGGLENFVNTVKEARSRVESILLWIDSRPSGLPEIYFPKRNAEKTADVVDRVFGAMARFDKAFLSLIGPKFYLIIERMKKQGVYESFEKDLLQARELLTEALKIIGR